MNLDIIGLFYKGRIGLLNSGYEPQEKYAE